MHKKQQIEPTKKKSWQSKTFLVMCFVVFFCCFYFLIFIFSSRKTFFCVCVWNDLVCCKYLTCVCVGLEWWWGWRWKESWVYSCSVWRLFFHLHIDLKIAIRHYWLVQLKYFFLRIVLVFVVCACASETCFSNCLFLGPINFNFHQLEIVQGVPSSHFDGCQVFKIVERDRRRHTSSKNAKQITYI